MLHIIYGTDRENVRAQFHKTREISRERCDNEHLVRAGEVVGDFLMEAASSVGLFGEKALYIFDNILDKEEEQEIIVAHANVLGASPNYFLVCESDFEKSLLKGLDEGGVSTQECVAVKTNSRPVFNIFSLGDALGRRSKKELWSLYQEAREAEIAPEEICGTLFWAVKNLALMKDAPVGALCGLNPFVAKKTREFANNYSKEEIVDLSRSLIAAYHNAHRGGEPMDIALERFALSI